MTESVVPIEGACAAQMPQDQVTEKDEIIRVLQLKVFIHYISRNLWALRIQLSSNSFN